ncbi:hypothetical protein ACFCX4_08920 [Kitasatospora sp. NPDC056327]|uniref:DUF6907 domain-containing protein n=1 Tax=Kitasatospora sp. NPDC056327 TaxID=3345785 RepID=UPI0035D9199B
MADASDTRQPGTTQTAGTCPVLGGICTNTEPAHWDHYGPITGLRDPNRASDTPMLDAQLMALDGENGTQEPYLCLGWAGDTADLDPAEALKLADDLDQFANQLRALARQLQDITTQA